LIPFLNKSESLGGWWDFEMAAQSATLPLEAFLNVDQLAGADVAITAIILTAEFLA
jgi:hypothetical protein